MLDLSLFLKAMGIGLAVAAPVGPMSLLCMRTTLTRGLRHGLAIGGGIALADGIYGAVAAFGLAGLSAFMLAHQKPLHLAAGLFLIWLGLKSLWARSAAGSTAKDFTGRSLLRNFATSVLLTLTNPPTIIMFSAVFAALTPAGGFHASDAAMTVAGVFAGSLLWWCGVVAVVTGLRHALGPTARLWIDRVSGLTLSALGVVELRRGFTA